MRVETHELMVCLIANEVHNYGGVVFGSYTPLAYCAYMLAKLTHAKDVTLIGYNAIDMSAVEMSYFSHEAAAYRCSTARMDALNEVNSIHLSHRGTMECLAPAQIDGTGAFNTSFIGDPRNPKVYLPGQAGASDVAQHYARMVLYIGDHSTRTLVPEVDFVSGNRWKISAEERRKHDLPVGPYKVITNLAVLEKEDECRPFRLVSVHSGLSVEEVVSRTGFELDTSGVIVTPDPDPVQLDLLRTRIDPHGTAKLGVLSGKERRNYLRQIIEYEWQQAKSYLKKSVTA
jgi:acyl CoA:acetate/3-ketoacid CoA transferase beta subunit